MQFKKTIEIFQRIAESERERETGQERQRHPFVLVGCAEEGQTERAKEEENT